MASTAFARHRHTRQRLASQWSMRRGPIGQWRLKWTINAPPRAIPLPPLLHYPIGPRLLGRRLTGRRRFCLRPANAMDAMNELCRLSLDLQVPVLISPPVVEDPIATQMTRNAEITSVALDIPLLAGEDLGPIEHGKSVVYFNRSVKQLSDMVDDMKAIFLGALYYEHVIQQFIGSASKRFTKAFQELDD
ncbi:hypothetical protein MRB53_035047 [Persea americana]|uniref:Uncharacterized protein n=1 Tax=Persea americana TaxID=3435 RepID=A0ACC2K3L9_PERAE|nr:hypothetical protein MRB53_035047 [Persea americana]